MNYFTVCLLHTSLYNVCLIKEPHNEPFPFFKSDKNCHILISLSLPIFNLYNSPQKSGSVNNLLHRTFHKSFTKFSWKLKQRDTERQTTLPSPYLSGTSWLRYSARPSCWLPGVFVLWGLHVHGLEAVHTTRVVDVGTEPHLGCWVRS